jgi:hypothetical protein
LFGEERFNFVDAPGDAAARASFVPFFSTDLFLSPACHPRSAGDATHRASDWNNAMLFCHV